MRFVSFLLLVVWCLGAPRPALGQQPDERAPARVEILLVQGMTKAFLGDYEGALTHYEEALRLAPNAPAVLAAYAEAQAARGDLQSAVYHAQQAVMAAPDNQHYHHQLAGLYLEMGQVEQAETAYEGLLQRFPRDTRALEELARLRSVTGRAAEAAATYERLLQLTGEQPEYLQALVQLYTRLGDDAATLKALGRYVAVHPDDAAAFRQLGRLEESSGNLEAARQAFARALRLDPSDAQAAAALAALQGEAPPPDADAPAAATLPQARLLLAQGNVAAAEATLQRVLAADSLQADALGLLGDLYYDRHAYMAAAPLLVRLVRLTPRDLTRWERALVAARRGGLHALAAPLAEEALLLFPGQPRLLLAAAWLALDQGRPGEALRLLDEARPYAEEADDPALLVAAEAAVAAAQPDAAAARRLLAPLRARAAAHPAAMPAYLEALLRHQPDVALPRLAETRPGDPWLAWLEGYGLLRAGRPAEALAPLQAAAEAQVSASALEALGDAHAALGHAAEARNAWRAAFALSPSETLRAKLEGRSQ